jgi:murein DD-endopeptidase MepM/ murein hydrolase activator NlpD
LRRFSADQQQMIVAHELTHWRRRDPLWLTVSIVLQASLWFIPMMRAFAARLNWAQELACDQQVLAGRPQQQRQSYAAALVAQLKLQHLSYRAAPGFGASHATLANRIAQIRHNAGAHLHAVARLGVGASLLALLAASVVLQPAFAWRSAQAPQSARQAPVQPWLTPIDNFRVTGFYGVVSPLRPKAHGGIDLAAKTGTTVRAAAAGKVVEVSELHLGMRKFGKVVVLEHANNMRTMYMHLNSFLVLPGQSVAAGQAIAQSGATGTVTGPHLHFEVWQGAQRIDPQLMLANLDAHASAHALRERDQKADR